ncbi:hypothetical protein [Hellea balneolensis]|uniref:hypothetical protein n=1 Tax=Hellea balneolensis TaxID=287478 RepID=UPI0003F82BBF|nr:hypothetical protein [Hellea balneolensis]
MSKSTRRPQQIFTIVMWLLSIIFAGFLIGLGGLIIKDLPQVDRQITVEQFADTKALEAADNSLENQQGALLNLRRNIEDAQEDQRTAREDYQSARASFNNWIKTRNATQSSAQNPEVIARNRTIEELKQDERTAQRDVQDAQTALRNAERELSDIRSARSDIISQARPKYRAAKRAQELRVFLFRLALTLPLLLVAGWLLMIKRKSAYWPLYRGFVLFALFAFFVELVPYLPHYGGYVRYTVGIIMAMIAGHFIIRSMRRYMERKKTEEARSESERRQSIEYETALKKIAAKTCPGCDRSIIQRDGVDTDFCVHCGIRLQEKCGSCGNRNISFHKFCLSCGVASPEPASGP